MSGLLELGPMTREIDVMGQRLTVRPITTREVIALFARFPQVVEFLDAKVDRATTAVRIGPEAVAHFVACATGELDKPGAVEAAQRLGIGKMMEVLDEIFEITFEDGFVPFLRRIKKFMAVASQPSTVDLEQVSSAPWSASLVGDAPRKPHLVRRRVS